MEDEIKQLWALAVQRFKNGESPESICTSDPSCFFLALNRMEFPEGFSCRHSNPIRYVVSGLRTGYTARTKHAT